MAFLDDLNYVVRSIWHDDSNRDQRLRRLSLFVGWQLWKRVGSRSDHNQPVQWPSFYRLS